MTIAIQEWRWAVYGAVAVLVLSCLPFLVVWQSTPPDWQFTGVLVNPLDGHSYLAKIEQGAAGQWLFHLTYTPETHPGAFIFTFYLALGHVARMTGLPNVIVFHLARLLAGLLLLLTVFRFVAHVTPHPGERRLAFGLIGLASGFGWLGILFGAFPIDLWVPEAFVHYSLYANPHFPLGMALMLFILIEVIWPPSPDSFMTAPILRPTIAALLLAIVLPFALIIDWVILIAFMGWRLLIDRSRLPWTQIWPTLGVIGGGLPIILYQYWVSTTNPILAGWSAQNITTAPPILDVIIGFGVIVILAVGRMLGMVRGRGQPQTEGEWVVWLWAVSSFILLYAPLALQRRFITGLHIPLSILAAIGLARWMADKQFKIRSQRLIIIISIVVISLLGTLFVWSLPMIAGLQPPDESPTTALLFIRNDEVAAFDWLRAHAQPDAVILASPRIGMFIPGQTGARAFYGHPFETINAADKEAQLKAFFGGQQPSTTPPSDYIFYGPSEQALGQPIGLANLPVVFSTGDVTIFKTQQP
ncbi:MAG: hypothetical protein KDI79_07455 [Anaerolineae bacterium]|nr:hypothetical protein [Anaerolineae bacterium]